MHNFFLIFIFFTSCTYSYQKVELDKAEDFVAKKKYDLAVHSYEKIIRREKGTEQALLAAQKAYKLSYYELKNNLKAIKYLNYLIMYSEDSKQRFDSQKKIANIYFKKLNNYGKSVEIYHQLLNINHTDNDDILFRENLVKSYYYLNDFFQSIIELDKLLKKKLSEDKKFEILFFKGKILFNTKKLSEAIVLFEELLKIYPELSKKENVGMSLAVCYEEQNELSKSIKTLEEVKKYYSDPIFIDEKINRLKERSKNLPGAKGLRK